jgi:hypothetical protein
LLAGNNGQPAILADPAATGAAVIGGVVETMDGALAGGPTRLVSATDRGLVDGCDEDAGGCVDVGCVGGFDWEGASVGTEFDAEATDESGERSAEPDNARR